MGNADKDHEPRSDRTDRLGVNRDVGRADALDECSHCVVVCS